MASIDQYLDAVTSYFSTSDRPYRDIPFPASAYSGITPAQVLQPHSRTLLVGEPGSGKTTFVDWVAQVAATERSYIPILASLRNYGSTLEDLLRVSIARFVETQDGIAPEVFDVERYPLAFLLDGLDEVSEAVRPAIESEIITLAARGESRWTAAA